MLIKGLNVFPFFFFISSGHFDEGMGAIVAISLEGYSRNISVKLF